MTPSDYTLRGYAASFNSSADILGVTETIAPGAFVLGFHCQLQFGHDGVGFASNTAGPRLRLWQDDYGLAFEAQLAADCYLVSTVRAVRRERLGCSVNFRPYAGESVFFCSYQTIGGQLHRRITRAAIDHIALAHRPAYGEATAVWIAGEEADLSPALAALARRWRDGTSQSHSYRTSLSNGRQSGAAARPPQIVSLGRAGSAAGDGPNAAEARHPSHPDRRGGFVRPGPELQARLDRLLADLARFPRPPGFPPIGITAMPPGFGR